MARAAAKPTPEPQAKPEPEHENFFFYGDIQLPVPLSAEEQRKLRAAIEQTVRDHVPAPLRLTTDLVPTQRLNKGREAVLVMRAAYGIEVGERADLSEVKRDAESARDHLCYQGYVSHMRIEIPPARETTVEDWL